MVPVTNGIPSTCYNQCQEKEDTTATEAEIPAVRRVIFDLLDELRAARERKKSQNKNHWLKNWI